MAVSVGVLVIKLNGVVAQFVVFCYSYVGRVAPSVMRKVVGVHIVHVVA